MILIFGDLMQNVKGLDTQLIWLQNWKAEVLGVAGPERGNFIISNTLYAISTGTNDWVNNYYVNPHLQANYPSSELYTAFLLGEAQKYIQVCEWERKVKVGIWDKILQQFCFA